MIKLADIYLCDEVADKLSDKLAQYNSKHPDDNISFQTLAEMFLDFGIRYLDITAID